MYVAPLTLATEWQTVQPMDMAVWTNFPLALSLWHSKHFEGSTFGGRVTGCLGISAWEADETASKTAAIKKTVEVEQEGGERKKIMCHHLAESFLANPAICESRTAVIQNTRPGKRHDPPARTNPASVDDEKLAAGRWTCDGLNSDPMRTPAYIVYSHLPFIVPVNEVTNDE